MVVFQMILLSVLFSLLEMPLLISYSCLGKKSGMSTWLTSLFPSDISSFILSIPLSQFGFEDRFIWGFSKNGDFSASSAYFSPSSPRAPMLFLISRPFCPLLLAKNLTWNFIWSLPIPHKIHFFLWQLCHECLTVGDLLVSRGWKGTSFCLFC